MKLLLALVAGVALYGALPSAQGAEWPRIRSEQRVQEPLVSRLVAAAIAGDNAQLEQVADELSAQPRPPRVDRRLARELNESGLALWQRQRFAEAAALFARAAEADPGDAEIAENLGYALLKAGRTADGKPAILRALTLGPERASAWGTLGLIFAKEGRHADAVACVVTAYRYARNRKRTLDVYTRLAATDEDPRVRSLFSDVVPRISATR